jgi:acyl dehydratase
VIQPVSLIVTLQRLVMEAAADRDFAPSHHDPEYARERGATTAYVNCDFVAALFERLLRSYTGPSGFLEHLEFRLVANATVGSTITASGAVEQVERLPDGSALVQVELRQDASGVQTAHGHARVRILPATQSIYSAVSPPPYSENRT